MKLVSIDQKWFIQTTDPIIPAFNSALNQGLKENKYVVASTDDLDCFTVMSMLGNGLEDLFTFQIIKLPNLETEPFIVFYKIKDRPLAEKFHAWLITFHPNAKVILSREAFLPPSEIAKLLSLF